MYYETFKPQNSMIDYEYATVNTSLQYVPLYEEYYYSAGWSRAVTETFHPNNPKKDTPVTLNFRRPRQWANNGKLSHLQDSCENTISKIIELKGKNSLGPLLISILIGIIGTIIIGFTNAYICELITSATPIFIVFPVMLSIFCITFLSIGPLYIYKRLYGEATRRTAPMLNEEYEKFDHLCEEIRQIVNPIVNE